MYARFLRDVVLPLGDRFRGIPIGRALEELERSQWLTPEEIRRVQRRKLVRLMRTAYESTEHYRGALDASGCRPEDIDSLEALRRIPLLSKETLRRAGPAIRNRSWPEADRYAHRTGGSTGEPLVFFLTGEARAYDRASYYRFLRWMGVERGDWVFNVWGSLVVSDRHTRLVKSLKHRFLSRRVDLDAFRMGTGEMDRFLETLQRVGPRLLRGYTSALTALARRALETKRAPGGIGAVSTTAEPVTSEDRACLERAFGAPVFDQYGCGEVGGIACECPEHTGLHVAAEHCIVEIVDEGGEPAPPGQPGRIAVTSLDNLGTPFIRYLNGDRAALLEEPCPCGRALPLMSAVVGRTSDMIVGLNGNQVHGEFFTHLLHELGLTESLPVREFQVIQSTPDRLEMALVAPRPLQGVERESLAARIRAYLGPMELTIRDVPSIDRTRTGKLRFTVRLCEIPVKADPAPRCGPAGPASSR